MMISHRLLYLSYLAVSAMLVMLAMSSAVYADKPMVARVTLALGDTSHPVQAPVYVGDTLTTGMGGQLHLTFIDNALLILRADTQVVVEDYQFTPEQPEQNRVRYHLIQGTVRSITGKAGEQNKAGYRMNTPLVAIGVRGTDFITQANSEQMRIAVISGGVMADPYSDLCQRHAYGPCNTAQGLAAGLGAPNAIAVRKSATGTLLTPIDWKPELSDMLGHPPVLDGSNTPKPSVKSLGEGEQSAQANQSLESVQTVYRDPVYWGRWANAAIASEGVAVLDASTLRANGYQPVAANQLLGLFVSPNVTHQPLPVSGQVQLSPAQAQVYYLNGNTLSTGLFNTGVLGIDFAERQVKTHLYTKASVDAPVDYLYAVSNLYNNGGFSSIPTLSNAQMSGVVFDQGQSAGMLFEQAKKQQVISGGVWWR